MREFFFPEDQARIMDEFFPAVMRDGHGEVEVRFRHFKTGAARWMAYKVLTLHDAAGNAVAFGTVSQDVTERRRMEEDLRTLAANLSEASRRKDEFLALLAHELRNPLAPISNAVQVLRRSGGDGGVVLSATGMLERQVGQMTRLVDELLDVSRITQGKIELRRVPLELEPIVHQAVEAARARDRSTGHELTVSLPAQPVHLDADPTRLAQVLGNLLNNAFKFTDAGGHIRLAVERDGAQAVIRVRDDGIGIAPDQQPLLFQMFSQLDTSLERSRDGLGIGLTLARSLVEMHGGTLEAHSEGLGHGSEFVVRLPLASGAGPAAGAEPRVSTPVGRRRILIVDDNRDGAESMALLLELEGHEAHLVHDGLAAVEAAGRLRPDAVLLDIGLPGLNGYEVCTRIRAEPWGRDIVLVAVTGWGQPEDRQRSSAAGFDTHIVKPVDHAALKTLLASLPR